MKKMKIGDTVMVTSGKDKGRTGEVLRMYKKDKSAKHQDRVVVRGIGMVSKHVKPDPQSGVTGGIEKQERSVHISNLSVLNSSTNKADRVGFRLNDQGLKYRIFKSDNEPVDTQADIDRAQKFRQSIVQSS